MAGTPSSKRSADAVSSSEPDTKRPKSSTSTEETKETFVKVFGQLKDEILADLGNLPLISDSIKKELVDYYAQCVPYTVMGGKMTRGLTVVKGCEVLLGKLSEEQMFKACVLGWCVEWLQAFFLVADDVMDESLTRRKQPCWYKQGHVTVANAVNDALILEIFIYRILKRHFGDHDCYLRLVELMHQTTYQTEVGQHLDTNGTLFGAGLDLSRFTLDRYWAIVTYKTAFYSFYLSCALAMTYAGETKQADLDLALDVCVKIGQYFQVQDDYLDCYGDPAVIGKVGTDIQDAKCSWLVCQALIKADAGQRKIIEENYGVWDDEKVNKIKSVYKDMDLEQCYADYEESTKTSVDAMIAQVKPQSLQPLFNFLLAKIYKRHK